MKYKYLILLLGIIYSINAMQKEPNNLNLNSRQDDMVISTSPLENNTEIIWGFNNNETENIKRFECGFSCCKFSADTKKELLNHKRSHCQLDLMRCSHCIFRTKDKEALLNHFKQHHGASDQQSAMEYEKVQTQLLQLFTAGYKKFIETYDKQTLRIIIQYYVILEPEIQQEIILALKFTDYGKQFYMLFLKDYEKTNKDMQERQQLVFQLKNSH